MNNKFIHIAWCFLILFILISCKSITLKGKIAVKGSEPHTYLVLVSVENGEYAIVGELKQEIWNKYQGHMIKVRGNVIKQAIGPGFPAELEVIQILEVY